MMWKITAELSGCGQLFLDRKRSSSEIGTTRGRTGSHSPAAIVRRSAFLKVRRKWRSDCGPALRTPV